MSVKIIKTIYPPLETNDPLAVNLTAEGTGIDELDKEIEIAGYSYDSDQDIFYSNIDPWQRHVGYCHLYDEAAPPLGMIIDCEPIYFDYNQKKWMIGFWKGQYDLVTGGEIGIYSSVIDLNIPGIFSGTFYKSASNTECLQMSFALKKKDKILFTRDDRHWWLTGFKLGEFSEPSQLTMEINLTLENEDMRNAFVSGLRNAGYLENEIKINENTVNFTFSAPRTRQPRTRNRFTDWIIQRKNELLCKEYQEITGPYDNFRDKIKAIEQEAPKLHTQIKMVGKNKQSFAIMSIVTMVITLVIACLAVTEGSDEQSSSEIV